MEARISIVDTTVTITQRFVASDKHTAALNMMQSTFPTETAGGEFQIVYVVERAGVLESVAEMFVGPSILGLNTIEGITDGEAIARDWGPNVVGRGGIRDDGSTTIVYRSRYDPYSLPELYNHEAGHGLGVQDPEHSPDRDNMMYEFVPRTGNQFTVDQLRQITNHEANNVTECSTEGNDAGLC